MEYCAQRIANQLITSFHEKKFSDFAELAGILSAEPILKGQVKKLILKFLSNDVYYDRYLRIVALDILGALRFAMDEDVREYLLTYYYQNFPTPILHKLSKEHAFTNSTGCCSTRNSELGLLRTLVRTFALKNDEQTQAVLKDIREIFRGTKFGETVKKWPASLNSAQ